MHCLHCCISSNIDTVCPYYSSESWCDVPVLRILLYHRHVIYISMKMSPCLGSNPRDNSKGASYQAKLLIKRHRQSRDTNLYSYQPPVKKLVEPCLFLLRKCHLLNRFSQMPSTTRRVAVHLCSNIQLRFYDLKNRTGPRRRTALVHRSLGNFRTLNVTVL